MKPLSLRAYARHRGVSLAAVQTARDSGRLAGALTADGRIRSAKEADRAWDRTTRVDRRPITGPAASSAAAVGATTELQDLRTRREAVTVELAEIELARVKGALVIAADVEAALTTTFTQCRHKLFGIPSRAVQRDPTLTAPQIALIEALIREACEELADGKVE